MREAFAGFCQPQRFWLCSLLLQLCFGDRQVLPLDLVLPQRSLFDDLQAAAPAAFAPLGFAAVPGDANAQTDVVGPSELCGHGDDEFSGKLPAGAGAEYYFFLAKSRRRDEEQPLIIWMTGGPGCSSSLAMLTENGPCSVQKCAQAPCKSQRRVHSWNANAHVVWVDQPGGVGFSTGPVVSNETAVAEHMLEFVRSLYLRFPELRSGPLYIWGESYGGHYVSSVARRILVASQSGEELPLAGAAIGNGLVNPMIQFASVPEMAYTGGTGGSLGHGVVSSASHDEMMTMLPDCLGNISFCQEAVARNDPARFDDLRCAQALMTCSLPTMMPVVEAGLNRYDLRKPCNMTATPLCYDMSEATEFLESHQEQRKLGVAPGTPWAVCNISVMFPFLISGDYLSPSQGNLEELLVAGIPVLIYSGDTDFAVNWVGSKEMAGALRWPGQEAWQGSPDEPWRVSGRQHGRQRSFGGLTFLQFFDAGHMVPMDQPSAALAMVERFTAKDSPWKASSAPVSLASNIAAWAGGTATILVSLAVVVARTAVPRGEVVEPLLA